MGNRNDGSKALLYVIIGMVLMAISVYFFFTYDYPSGKTPGLVEFFMFFFRELILVGILLIAAVIAIAAKVSTVFHPKTEDEQRTKH